MTSASSRLILGAPRMDSDICNIYVPSRLSLDSVCRSLSTRLFQNTCHGVVGPGEHSKHEYPDRYDFCKAIATLRFNRITGDYAEFGCCGAVTFRIAHKLLTTYSPDIGPFHMWAFDSFEGLPATVGSIDEHPNWQKGKFSMSLEAFRRNANWGDPVRCLHDRAGFLRTDVGTHNNWSTTE